ncbi:unnamed protein product [Rhizophagus irregularis]|nr:unnamed protein product [Rhizophagus irregularis]CAB5346046.1 unnamed protein product [Rhizophagus irregularis]
MSSNKIPPKTKPVNDLIKFWASQQQEEKEKSGSDLKSSKRPLSPNASVPSSPKQPLSPRQRNFRDTPTSSPPLSPTNINRSITDTSKSIIQKDNPELQISINDFTTSSNDAESSSSYVTFIKESSPINPPDESNLTVQLRDPTSRAKAATQLVQRDSLPLVKNVSDIVSKFEKVVSPPTSPTTLTSMKKGQTTIPESMSAKPMSPVKRNQTIEPLSISQPLSDAISDTLISKLNQRDINPLDLSITTTSNESLSFTEPLYSPIKPPSMKRRSNIPDPIVIPSPTTSTNSVKEVQLFNDESETIISPSSPKKEQKEQVVKEPKKITSPISSTIKSIVSPTIKLKLKSDTKSNSNDDQKPKIESKPKSEIKSPKFESSNIQLTKRHIENLPQIRPTSEFDIDFLENTSSLPLKQNVNTGGENSSISRQVEQNPFINKSTSLSNQQQSVSESESGPISPKKTTSILEQKSVVPNKVPIPEPKSPKKTTSILEQKSVVSTKVPTPESKSPKKTTSILEQKSVVPIKVPTPEPKSPISPKDDSQKRSTISSPKTFTESLPQVSLSSPTDQETTEDILSDYTSSPIAQSPNLDSTPIGSIPNSPEFLHSNFALELLPEITPISPFWNPAVATGSNTVSPLWKPLPDNQNRPISPILKPEPDNSLNSLSQQIASIKNEIESNNINNNDNNNILTKSGRKSSDLWFKKSSASFLTVPEFFPQSATSFQEPVSRSSGANSSDLTANSYIFSFLSQDTDSWNFFAESPNTSSANLRLDLNPFNSYLDNAKEDNDATDVENEDQNYNPFVDTEEPSEPSGLSGDKRKKYLSETVLYPQAIAIEMQVTHSRSSTRIDDESDPIKPVVNIIDSSGNMISSDDESRKQKKYTSVQSLDSVAKYKQRRRHTQHKYKPVQIQTYPYSETRPQRYTLSLAFILKDKQNNMTVKDFSPIMNDDKENANTLDISVANMTESLDPACSSRFIINPFDGFEKNGLFLPGTPWVYLPHLDEYIRSFPKTEFSNPKEVMTSEEYEIFLAQGKSFKNPENLFPLISQSTDNYPNNTPSTSQVKGKDESKNDGPSERGIARSLPPSSEGCQESTSILYEQRFLKLEIIRDFIQFTALALSFVTPGMLGNDRIYILLRSVPNFMSFNMDQVFGFGAVFLLIFCVIGFVCLFMFRKIANWKKVTDVENLESSSRFSLLQSHIIVFILTTLYVPLTKLSLDALVWSDNFWPVKNPYLPDVDFPDFVDVGNGALRSPKDFCYVTSMNKNDTNLSPFIIALGILNLALISFWFPIKLRKTVNKHMNRFGFARNDKDEEDDNKKNPHKFIYDGYNDNWSTYKSFIMIMKFLLIFLIVVFSKDNCLFRSTTRQRISTIAQALKIVLFVLFFIPHWKSEPFVYSNFNTAEYWSRFAYLITSFVGLLIVLQAGPIQGYGIGLFVINIAVLTIIIWYLCKEINYFNTRYAGSDSAYGTRSVVGGGRNFGKKELEFSFDISSSGLDFDKFIKERIWQDTWTKLLLTNDNFKPPAGKTLSFNEESEVPYLLDFSGSVGERHIENSKILSKVGSQSYVLSLKTLSSSMSSIRSKILNNYVGVDMYYAEEYPNVKETYFGKASVIPFPFCIVICYDENDNIVTLKQEWEIQRYLQQNEDEVIQRRRLIRQKIRALEGKNIIGPCFTDSDKVHNHRGVLSIQRKQESLWREHNMNPGFKVTITYTDSTYKGNQCPQVVGHNVIGITGDFKMTHQLEKLFGDNRELIGLGLVQIQKTMDEYRQYCQNESISKETTLTYGFHINVFNNPSISLEALPSLLITTEKNQLVQSIPEREYPTMIYLYERMRAVHTSKVHQWWYLFWEDLWKNNGQQIPHLRKYEQDFSPLYRSSICYQPMERCDLEDFMERRGLWTNNGKYGLFHSGVLNRIYLYLNSVVFSRKGKDGSPKKWRISKDSIQDQLGEKSERNTIIDKVGIVKSVINRNSHNSKKDCYVMREEDSESDFEDVELDNTNNNSVSDDETLCY